MLTSQRNSHTFEPRSKYLKDIRPILSQRDEIEAVDYYIKLLDDLVKGRRRGMGSIINAEVLVTVTFLEGGSVVEDIFSSIFGNPHIRKDAEFFRDMISDITDPNLMKLLDDWIEIKLPPCTCK